mmetsp:Transcript_32291/g.70663  ORF Transcript_32291/g.70663 Transcript_32291/m.70663 type:complete len:749 (+) Transcript_32291:61-2307(+)
MRNSLQRSQRNSVLSRSRSSIALAFGLQNEEGDHYEEWREVGIDIQKACCNEIKKQCDRLQTDLKAELRILANEVKLVNNGVRLLGSTRSHCDPGEVSSGKVPRHNGEATLPLPRGGRDSLPRGGRDSLRKASFRSWAMEPDRCEIVEPPPLPSVPMALEPSSPKGKPPSLVIESPSLPSEIPALDTRPGHVSGFLDTPLRSRGPKGARTATFYDDGLHHVESNRSAFTQETSMLPIKNRRLQDEIQAVRNREVIEKKPWREMGAADVLKSGKFDNSIGALIILNAATIGLQADYGAKHVTEVMPPPYVVIEKIFLCIFLSELLLRIWVYRYRFFYGEMHTLFWNYFDLSCVVSQVAEELISMAYSTSSNPQARQHNNFRLLKVLRTLRLLRILRVMRVLHLISELRTIVSSILGSFQSLLWTVVLLLLMIYVVAVAFTNQVTEHAVEKELIGDEPSTLDAKLRYYFGSLGRTVLSLWQAMSGGADWDEMAGPLIMEVHPLWGVAFAAYIAFALLALMNVVTGVFVQTALNSAKDEEDAFVTSQIVGLFNRDFKEDGDGMITLKEIHDILNDPHRAKEWRSINVTSDQVTCLFELLDVFGTGSIKFDEFLNGCLRLNGSAKSVDLQTVMQEARARELRFGCRVDNLDQGLEDAHRLLDSILDAAVGCNSLLTRKAVEADVYQGQGQGKAAATVADAARRLDESIDDVRKCVAALEPIIDTFLPLVPEARAMKEAAKAPREETGYLEEV